MVVFAGPLERLLDGLPEHEMGAQEPHRLPRRHSHGGKSKPLQQALENGFGGLARLDQSGEPGEVDLGAESASERRVGEDVQGLQAEGRGEAIRAGRPVRWGGRRSSGKPETS